MRKKYTAQFKARVALEAIKGDKTIAQISSQYEVHPNQIGNWKKQLLEYSVQAFTKHNGNRTKDKQNDTERDELYKQIGELKVERDFLKKKYEQLFGK